MQHCNCFELGAYGSPGMASGTPEFRPSSTLARRSAPNPGALMSVAVEAGIGWAPQT